MFRRRAPEPVPAEPEREVSPLAMYRAALITAVAYPFEGLAAVTALELYGARVLPDYMGWCVYAFSDPGGRVWYAGQSENIWSRWRDHYYKFGVRFAAADKWFIKVANQAEADLAELALIAFYQPECNDKGRRADLEAKVRAWNRGTRQFDQGVHKLSLDRSQATD